MPIFPSLLHVWESIINRKGFLWAFTACQRYTSLRGEEMDLMVLVHNRVGGEGWGLWGIWGEDRIPWLKTSARLTESDPWRGNTWRLCWACTHKYMKLKRETCLSWKTVMSPATSRKKLSPRLRLTLSSPPSHSDGSVRTFVFRPLIHSNAFRMRSGGDVLALMGRIKSNIEIQSLFCAEGGGWRGNSNNEREQRDNEKVKNWRLTGENILTFSRCFQTKQALRSSFTSGHQQLLKCYSFFCPGRSERIPFWCFFLIIWVLGMIILQISTILPASLPLSHLPPSWGTSEKINK